MSTQSVSSSSAEMRTWTDDSGKHAVEAESVEIKPDGVVLKNTSGAKVTVPLDRLSAADLEYLRTLPDSAPKPLSLPGALTEPPAWNDANTPFDIAVFIKPPPIAENAAPLYLDALSEFDSVMLDTILGRYKELSDAGKAEYERLHRVFRDRRKKYERFEELWEQDPNSVDTAEVDTWLAEYDTGFTKLAAAQQRPQCMFQTGYSIGTLLPHIQATRQVSRVVQWQIRRDLQRGDLQRPVQDIKMLLRLTRDLRIRGMFVVQLVADAIENITCKGVHEILNAPGMDVETCDKLLALLTEHEYKKTNAFAEGNRVEYIMCRQGLYDLQYRTGDFDPETMAEAWGFEGDMKSPLVCFKLFHDLGGTSNTQLTQQIAKLTGKLQPEAWQGGKMLSAEDYAHEVAVANSYFATMLDLAGKPDLLWKGDATIKTAEAPLEETLLVDLLAPVQQAVLEVCRRSEARLQGTKCLVALRRWQLLHKEPPTDLEALVRSAGMPDVPIDPYCGKPLQMRLVEGIAVIYSVGVDRKDDQGLVEWDTAPGTPGDFLFRLDKEMK